MIRELGPNTIILSKADALSLASGADFSELMRRPNLTVDDARAIERLAPSVGIVDIWMGQGWAARRPERVFYGGERTPTGWRYSARPSSSPRSTSSSCRSDASSPSRKCCAAGGSWCSATPPYQALFEPSGIDPIGKKVRVGAIEYTVVGVLASGRRRFRRPDHFVVIPQTTHQVVFATNARRGFGGGSSAQITIVPVEGATRDQAVAEIEEIMRIRHGLKLDEPNDFEIGGQDAILRVWDQISRAVFLALVVISSIALMVGGIGVMAIMMISVTERTREIGVRKALGARRQEILFQFLSEAAVLTSVGGILGILCGSGHRGGHQPGHRLPHLAAVVVVCDRPRLLRQRRHLLRHGARRAGVATRSDRSAALRMNEVERRRQPPPPSVPRALRFLLARSDPIALQHRQHEHAAVTDLSRSGLPAPPP